MSLEKIQARDTVGKISSEMLLKEPCSRDPIELERAMHTDYVKNVEECVTTAKKEFLGDFFVVVLTKKEHLMQNVLRHYFLARQSCPTPNYDQTIYHYSRIRDDVNFLWTIPSKETCIYFIEEALRICPEEYGLLKCVLEFADGTLFKKAKRFNGEKDDSPELI